MYKISKNPCKKCGTFEKYSSNNHCVFCLKEKQKNQGNKYAKKYRQTHKDELNIKSKAEYDRFGKKFIYLMWSRAKKRAEEKDLPFDIEVSDIIIPDVCPVLGIKFSVSKNGKGPGDTSPSLDRIDGNLGYTKGNIKVISFKANRIKSDANVGDVEKVLIYMKSAPTK
jgi:hypothetical protein